MLKKTNLLVVVLLSLFLLLSSSKIALAIDLANTSAIQEIGQPDLSTNTSNANGLWYPMDLTTDGTKLFIGEYGCRVSVYNTPPTANFVAKDYVIGEPDKSFGCEGTLLSPTSRAVWDAMSVATDGVHFFVVDSQDNRVLIYDSIPTSSNQAADVVLGQPDMTSNADNNGGLSASSLSGPYGISVYGTKLIVTDTGNWVEMVRSCS